MGSETLTLTRHGHLREGQNEGGGVGLDDTGVVAGHVWDGIEEDDTSLDIVENESSIDENYPTKKSMS